MLLSSSIKVKPVLTCASAEESTGFYYNVKQRKSLELAAEK
jgi:hypothetical protein